MHQGTAMILDKKNGGTKEPQFSHQQKMVLLSLSNTWKLENWVLNGGQNFGPSSRGFQH